MAKRRQAAAAAKPINEVRQFLDRYFAPNTWQGYVCNLTPCTTVFDTWDTYKFSAHLVGHGISLIPAAQEQYEARLAGAKAAKAFHRKQKQNPPEVPLSAPVQTMAITPIETIEAGLAYFKTADAGYTCKNCNQQFRSKDNMSLLAHLAKKHNLPLNAALNQKCAQRKQSKAIASAKYKASRAAAKAAAIGKE